MKAYTAESLLIWYYLSAGMHTFQGTTIISIKYSDVHTNMQRMARLLCIRKSNPNRDNEGKVLACLCC